MKMYRAVPEAGFDSTKVYGPQVTKRMPSNVPFLVDNVWEMLRPCNAPSRRHAVYASPTPELALVNASAAGADPSCYVACEVVTSGEGILLAHLQVTDARLHPDIARIVRMVSEYQGREFAELSLEEKMTHGALYLPAIGENDLFSYFQKTVAGRDLCWRLGRFSTFWSDASCKQQEHNGELFFQLPVGGSYVLKPL